ncbi:LysR family transcriptional regulator [Asanoa sp. WMMD1127]|uniref:LysR family transcriptional regulator n=1 Tax=Asanoa sp. WMMD1127 TaxID=3016107 RepID=UPI002416623D|nr:LysR family transcriptional regulator [Asanoa sp. WMMD1127]MDG4825646.1 LysR family transcriptional regulator [Asanoa sp. WMMD1127]
MDPRQVRNFLAVVEHGGFGRAAAALGLAQPTLSQSVKALERELGVALFRRVAHGVVPSGAGRRFVGPARQLMHDVARLGASVGGHQRAVLELVAGAPLAVHPGARLVGSFVAAHPDVLVHLDRAPDWSAGDAVVTRVRTGVSELGLDYLPAPLDDLHTVALGRHTFVLAFPPGTSVAAGPVPLSTLDGHPLVGVPHGSTQRRLVEAALRDAGVRPRLVVECGQRDLSTALVLAGVGAAFLTDAAAPEVAARGAVVRPVEPPLRLAYGLVHRPGALTAIAAAFVDHARA